MTKTRVAVAAPRGTAQSWPKMIEPSLVRRCVVIFGLWQSSRLFYAAAGFCDSLIVIDFFPTHSRYSPLQVALLLLRWGLRAARSAARSVAPASASDSISSVGIIMLRRALRDFTRWTRDDAQTRPDHADDHASAQSSVD